MFLKQTLQLFFICLGTLTSFSLYAQGTFQFNNFPEDLQLYERNLQNNYGTIPVSGSISSNEYNRLELRVTRDGALYDSKIQNISGSSVSFNFTTFIEAQLANYKIELIARRTNGSTTVIRTADDVVAGDVIIINGQSNAEDQRANNSASNFENEFIRVYESGFAVSTNRWYVAQGDGDRTSNGNAGQWGLIMAFKIVAQKSVPVAIFNGSHGGTVISFFARNNNNPNSTSTNYGKLLSRLQETNLTNAVRAFIWYQGETDAGSITDQQYYNQWITLYNNWKNDIPGIEEFYIHQIRVGCNRTRLQTIDVEEAHRRLANDLNDVTIMTSKGAPLYSDACHYDLQGSEIIADRMFELLNRDLYGSPSNNIEPPQPNKITKTGNNQLTIEMTNSSDSYLIDGGAFNSFAFNGGSNSVSNGSFSGRNLVLNMSSSVDNLTSVTYYGVSGGLSTTPYIKNGKGIGMVSFKNFPIDSNNTGGGGGGSTNGPFLTGNTGGEDCVGPWIDTDNDGICDAADICEGGDDFLDANSNGIPDACDNGNGGGNTGGGTSVDPFLTGNTGGENCTGPWLDSDGDGICNAADICEGGDDFADADNDGIPDACDGGNTGGGNTGVDCPSLNADIGDSCNDGNSNTSNDVVTSNCQCAGSPNNTGGGGNTATYCSSQSNNVSFEFIQRVVFGSINNNSGNNGGYGDFTGLTANVSRGNNVNVTLTPGFTGTTYNEYWNVWIDFNQDGDFTDSGENVYSVNGSTSASSGNVSIPSNATLGQTRMRITMQWNSAPSPCSNPSYGEVEDYTVNITNSVDSDDPTFRIVERQATLSIFPNPVSDQLNVEVEGLSTAAQLHIYNSNGQLIKNQRVTQDASNLILDVSGFNAGIYNLILLNEDQIIQTKRFIKMNP